MRAALLCLLIVRPFGNVIAWSVVLAIVCSPLHQRLLRKTGRVSLSALAASLLVVFAFVVPLALIAGVAITQGVGLADSLPPRRSSGDGELTLTDFHLIAVAVSGVWVNPVLPPELALRQRRYDSVVELAQSLQGANAITGS